MFFVLKPELRDAYENLKTKIEQCQEKSVVDGYEVRMVKTLPNLTEEDINLIIKELGYQSLVDLNSRYNEKEDLGIITVYMNMHQKNCSFCCERKVWDGFVCYPCHVRIRGH